MGVSYPHGLGRAGGRRGQSYRHQNHAKPVDSNNGIVLQQMVTSGEGLGHRGGAKRQSEGRAKVEETRKQRGQGHYKSLEDVEHRENQLRVLSALALG
jgi:hypothetical protein